MLALIVLPVPFLRSIGVGVLLPFDTVVTDGEQDAAAAAFSTAEGVRGAVAPGAPWRMRTSTRRSP